MELVFGADCQRAGIFHSSDDGVADAAGSGEPGMLGMFGMSDAPTCGCPGGIFSPAAPAPAPAPIGGCPGGSGSSLSAIGIDVGIAAAGGDEGGEGSDPMVLAPEDVERPSANAAAEEMTTIPKTEVRLRRTPVV